MHLVPTASDMLASWGTLYTYPTSPLSARFEIVSQQNNRLALQQRMPVKCSAAVRVQQQVAEVRVPENWQPVGLPQALQQLLPGLFTSATGKNGEGQGPVWAFTKLSQNIVDTIIE